VQFLASCRVCRTQKRNSKTVYWIRTCVQLTSCYGNKTEASSVNNRRRTQSCGKMSAHPACGGLYTAPEAPSGNVFAVTWHLPPPTSAPAKTIPSRISLNFTEFKKMPTEFYFEIQYINFDWKITITLLRSHRNTQQWQVGLESALFRVRIHNSPLFPFNSVVST